MNVKEYCNVLESSLKLKSDPSLAEPMIAYMRNQFDYMGIKSVPRKEVTKAFWKANGLPNESEATEFAKVSWDSPYREMQYAGMETIFRMKKTWNEQSIDAFEYMICNKSWWDTVDFISSNLVGKWALKFPETAAPIIDRYSEAENFWLNRVSLIFQLTYKDKTDWELMKTNILKHTGSNEFFIKKAIGWTLRQYAKTNAPAVKAFILQHKGDLKPLSFREAAKHLDL